MTERCQGSGGKCPHEAVTTCMGLHICEMHADRLEWGKFVDDAPDFADNVPIERLRQIQAAGGLVRLLAEVDSLRAENATLREDNARLTAALEAQGQRAFIAGMRVKADLGELAREIAEWACVYLTGEKPDTEVMQEVIGAILKDALEGEQQ